MARYLLISLPLLLAACSHQAPAPISSATGPEAAHRTAAPSAGTLRAYLDSWRGVPYAEGGTTRRGVDCSALVYQTYRDVYGIELPRTAKGQSRQGRTIGRGELQPGDLVFFRIGWLEHHVGIYTGDGAFVHASASRGVTRSRLESAYWADRFWKAKRVR